MGCNQCVHQLNQGLCFAIARKLRTNFCLVVAQFVEDMDDVLIYCNEVRCTSHLCSSREEKQLVPSTSCTPFYNLKLYSV